MTEIRRANFDRTDLSSGRRVAFAGFFHETNTFAPGITSYDDFLIGGGYLPLMRGTEMVTRLEGLNVATAGGLEYGATAGWTTIPILWTCAAPGPMIAEDAYERLADNLCDCLVEAGTIDGLFLDLHGAMVANHEDDGEGRLLRRLRQLLGPDVPIAVSLDMHANVTAEMVDLADVIVGFRTYPHVDIAENGRRVARALDRMMGGERFQPAFRRIDYLIPITWQYTGEQPAQGLFSLVEKVEEAGAICPSFFTGFPAADVPGCGPTVLTYAVDCSVAEHMTERISAAVLAAEGEFAGTSFEPDEAITKAMAIAARSSRPVVIADTQDNPGAGGSSDTTGMLRALLRNGARSAAIGLIRDPAAAAAAHAAGIGGEMTIALGGRSGVAGDSPLEGRFKISMLSEGKVIAPGSFYQGAEVDLGPSACLDIDGVRVLVSTNKVHLVDPEFYRMFGIEPGALSILVNKSSVHFRLDFEPLAEAVLVARAPGAMILDPAELPWTRLRKGMRLRPKGPEFPVKGD